MESVFQGIVADYRAKGLTVNVEFIGERPCAKGVDREAHKILLEKGVASIRAVLALGSTDCNIPLSMGIPAICMGACTGHYCHTGEEELDLESLPVGSRLTAHFFMPIF